jgi:hypothetical protein
LNGTKDASVLNIDHLGSTWRGTATQREKERIALADYPDQKLAEADLANLAGGRAHPTLHPVILETSHSITFRRTFDVLIIFFRETMSELPITKI